MLIVVNNIKSQHKNFHQVLIENRVDKFFLL